tara:strand:+ start:6123 stop:6686 length:564 start_codon:yes stop_codon:yes gene_type:complete
LTNSKQIILKISGFLFIIFNIYFLFENGNVIKNHFIKEKNLNNIKEKIEYSMKDFKINSEYSVENFKSDCHAKGGIINENENCEFVKNKLNIFQLYGSIISLSLTLFIIILSLKIYIKINSYSLLSKENLKDVRNIMICLFLIPVTKLLFFETFIPLYATYATLSLIIYIFFSSAHKEIETANKEII